MSSIIKSPCVCGSIDELKTEIKDFFKRVSPGKVAILCDSNTLSFCYPKLAQIPELIDVEVIEVEPGEGSKSLEVVAYIWETLLQFQFHRNDLIIGLGGGMITDLAGFISHTYKRGISSLFLPTSLLGMVDAAIGGKNGINFGGAKNQIGTINPNSTIMVCEDFLNTLPNRELKAGAIESLKHGMIGDAALFDQGLQNLLSLKETDKLKNSIEVKIQFVKVDPYESGIRKALNFGHTVGHALESASNGKLLHGEAIAFGLLVETHLSVKLKGLRPQWYEKLFEALVPQFAVWKDCEVSPSQMGEYLKFDKKNVSERINLTLLSSIGSPEYDVELSKDEVVNAIEDIWSQL